MRLRKRKEEAMASNANTQGRPLLRIFTQHEVVDGYLGRGALMRTLDELNVPSRQFLFVHSPKVAKSRWALEDAPIVLNKSAILFATEIAEGPSKAGRQGLVVPCTRALTRVFIGDYVVKGFLHMPVNGDLAKRLDQDDHCFMALTSVSITGPDLDCSVPFVAVNRGLIISLQVLQLENREPAKEQGIRADAEADAAASVCVAAEAPIAAGDAEV
jgi:hypothetical protein